MTQREGDVDGNVCGSSGSWQVSWFASLPARPAGTRARPGAPRCRRGRWPRQGPRRGARDDAERGAHQRFWKGRGPSARDANGLAGPSEKIENGS